MYFTDELIWNNNEIVLTAEISTLMTGNKSLQFHLPLNGLTSLKAKQKHNLFIKCYIKYLIFILFLFFVIK